MADATTEVDRVHDGKSSDHGPGEAALTNGSAVSPRVTVVIPTLNEAKNLPHVFAAMPAGLYELIIVDGHSTDGTTQVAKQLRPDVRILIEERRGKGSALACGFAAARGDIIVTLDADGSMDPHEIPGFVDALLDGADFAKGSRNLPGCGSDDNTWIRSLGNRWLGGVANVFLGTRYTDINYGYSAFWRRALDAISVDCDGFEVETLICIRVARAGLVVREVGSYERRRLYGVSKLHPLRDGTRVLQTIMREWARPQPRVTVDLAAGHRTASERAGA